MNSKVLLQRLQHGRNFSTVWRDPPHEHFVHFIVIFCKFYKHLMKENVGGEELGKPKSHCVGSPTVLFFCINIENLDRKEDFFSS